MTHEQILTEFKYRSEAYWKVAKQERKDTHQTAEYRGMAQAYDAVIDFLEGNAEWV